MNRLIDFLNEVANIYGIYLTNIELMKIDKKNPEHLVALAVSAANSIIAVCARPFLRQKDADKKIIFYGHTLNGNLKAFYDYLLKQDGYDPYFLALDKQYYKRLKSTSKHPETILNALSTRDMLTVARADAFITSHGLHFFSIIRALTNIKFIDVWHAISYKGFGDKEFGHLHAHDEAWVSSKDMEDLYINRYGFKPSQIKITGYGRTDQLIDGSLNKQEIIRKYSIPQAKKYILIAPTWQQDVQGRSVLPFGMDEHTFFQELDGLAAKNSAHVIFRTHLNSGDEINVSHLSNTSFMPYSRYEVVEDFLFIADILVTDWSSVGVDYLPLKRPTIFLDVPAPFKYGFNLEPEHRFGDVVSDFLSLKTALAKYLKKPEEFLAIHSKDVEKTTQAAYGRTLDGHSCRRYFNNLARVVTGS